MNKKILTIAIVSATMLLTPGKDVFAAILPSEVMTLVNEDRIAAGLSPFVENDALTAAARMKADDMAMNQYFSHTSPKGVTPWEWFHSAQYVYRFAGENLAIHFHDAVSEERAWMESKKHCENIMSPKYREIGVAVRQMTFEGKETTVAVQMFGTQMTDATKVNIAEKGIVSCPKTYPSVLGSSLSVDQKGGMTDAVAGFLADTAAHWKIDTVRLLVLVLVAILQVAGLSIVLSFFAGNHWLRKW